MKINTDQNKKYGILLSGGLDSAVLLSMLIKNNPGLTIQPFTIPKKDGAMLYVNSIISHINDKFNSSVPATIEVGDPNAYHNKQNISAVLDTFQNHIIDYLFIAINRIPEELKDYPGAPVRATGSDHFKILMPFVDMTKDEILSIMVQEEFLELIDITHTCTEQTVGRCNVCWQCTERKWAFSKLNIADTGTT